MPQSLYTTPPWQCVSVIRHSQRLRSSFEHWTGQPLLPMGDVQTASEAEIAQALFEAPFVLISHGTEAEPVFNYANRRALEQWQLDWDTFTQMPSRRTAEPMLQAERDRLLAQAARQGYVPSFTGIRITPAGQRFRIENGILWNVIDQAGRYWGQAAIYSHWIVLD
ncbi:MEKHLA domain-containing protein [Trichothermofontia sp.]